VAGNDSLPADLRPEKNPLAGSKRLLIGTVFIDASELQRKWFDIQWRFLTKTTANFYHVTFMSDGSQPVEFSDRTFIIPSDKPDNISHHAHVYGLERLLEYFRSRADDYDYFLFLDSDAFPIRPGWLELLSRRMTDGFEIAAAIRPENLETRLHSSILLAKREALPHLSFEVGDAGIDLVGTIEKDVIIPAYQSHRRNKAFPLLRSNRFSLHPLLCGIYYHVFYHNGCGSGREFKMRGQSYWNHMCDEKTDPLPWIENLMADPEQFLSRLASQRL
jgi:hypothetical protein